MMMLKKLGVLLVLISANQSYSQVLYSENFSTLTSLITETNTINSTTFLYADVPATMATINNGGLIADTTLGNYPFYLNGQKEKAWLIYKPSYVNDTFAVSTSWLNPVGTASAWLITPIISNIAINSVLTWEAMAPDASNLDGYDIYISTSASSAPSVGDFTAISSITAEGYNWKKRGLSLGAYAGQNIRIAFKNNSTDKYQLWLDDIKVENMTNGSDVAATSCNVYKYSTINTNNVMAATFKNNGYSPITSLTINYQVGAGSIVSEIKTFSPALNYLDSDSLTFTTLFSSSSPAYHTMKLWASNINGQTDQLHANDTAYGPITLSTAIPTKRILVEQFTGALCTSCPDGYTRLNDIVSTNTNVIAASIHTNDQMAVSSGTLLTADYAPFFSNAPLATVDQYYFPDNVRMDIERNDWNTYITKRESMIVPASVSVTAVSYNSTTHEISATVSSNFVGDVKGDYRLNLYVKENNVFGPLTDSLSDNQWNQHNGLYTVPSSPYYQSGNDVSSSDPAIYLLSPLMFKHQYVVDAMLDGAYGTSGIIPSNASTIGQTYTKSYTYTLTPPVSGEFRYNPDNIYLIGLLTEYHADTKQRTVVNSAEVKLTSNVEVVGIHEFSDDHIAMTLFPNPTSDICYLNYTLKEQQTVIVSIYNMLGSLVFTESLTTGSGEVSQGINLGSLTQGTYNLVLSTKTGSITKKLTIIK